MVAVALLPAREVNLRTSVRTGVLSGVVAVFISAVGMIERFHSREIFGPLTLSYLALIATFIVMGYRAAAPPPVLEGYEEPYKGGRNLLAGVICGALGGTTLGLFVVLGSSVNLRGVFPNISPALMDVLTFNRGTSVGVSILVLSSSVVATVGGSIQLLPRQLRRAFGGAILWVIILGLLKSVFSSVLRGMRIPEAIPFLYAQEGGLTISGLVLIAVIAFLTYYFLGRRDRKMRDRIGALPEKRRRIVVLAGIAVAVIVLGALPQVVGVFLAEVLSAAGVFLLMALGLNIVVGFAGLLDLGYVAFFAVGAYTTAILTSPISPRFTPELTFWAALPFVLLAAAVAGLLVGTPVLRMRGDYLAIVTLGFGEITRLLFLSDWLEPTFGAARGIRRVPDIAIGPIVMKGSQDYFYAILLFVLLAAYISWALQRSRMGRAWMAMREDESVAEAMGVNIVAAKLWAFIIGAIVASFGGALFATRIGSVFPQSFDVVVSFTVLVLVIVGGLASIPGVIVGAIALVALPELLREFEQYRFLLYGALLILMMLKRPEGFIPSRRRARELHEEEVEQDDWLKAEAAT